MTTASRYITSASRYHPRYLSRSSMYIRSLIPRNFAELAEAVPIVTPTWRHRVSELNPWRSTIHEHPKNQFLILLDFSLTVMAATLIFISWARFGYFICLIREIRFYTMHNKFSNFVCFASLCAHLCAMSNNFKCNDENRILGK